MKNLKAENKLVVALFVMVLVTFSFAQKDSKRIERLYVQAPEKQEILAANSYNILAQQAASLAQGNNSR